MVHVKNILVKQFPNIWESKVEVLEEQLVNPFKFKYQSILFIAENIHDTIGYERRQRSWGPLACSLNAFRMTLTYAETRPF